MIKNRNEAMSLGLGVDLIQQANFHLQLLKDVHSINDLRKPEVLKRALYRYERYWLPLAAASSKKGPLTAPIDIEWVWHCHMMSPIAYARDCQELVGRTVDHVFRGKKDFSTSYEVAFSLWNERYGNEEPFSINFNESYDYSKTESFASSLSYDVISAAERHFDFYYQVSLPHYRFITFLETSLNRYKQFLYLKSKLPKDFLVPCCDIDLMWRTHILNPLIYKEDTEIIIGTLFNHDDSSTDRNAGSTLCDATIFTASKWNACYDEYFTLNGAMYRGSCHNGLLYRITQGDINKFCNRSCLFTIDRLTLHLPELISNGDFRITCATSDEDEKEHQQLFAVKPKLNKGSSAMTCTDLGHHEISLDEDTKLIFKLKENNKFLCFNSYTHLGKSVVDVLPFMVNKGAEMPGGPVETKTAIGNGYTLDIIGAVSILKPCKFASFNLQQGEYSEAIIPADIKTLWGPVPLEKLPPYIDNKCQVASHRLTDFAGNVQFTVRVIHSQPLLMSVIQVYYHDKMAAVGHLMRPDQLPLPKQTAFDGDAPTLDPTFGERAILIKNEVGDWGIITGKWTNFRIGVDETYTTDAITPKPGALKVKYFRLGKDTHVSDELKYKYSYFKTELDHMKVDLMKGKIRVNTSSDDVAENIALAFSVALLHVLCVPREKDWKEGQPVKPVECERGMETIEVVPSDDMALVSAAGLITNTPSNHYITNHYGRGACLVYRGGQQDGSQDMFTVDERNVVNGVYTGSDGIINVGQRDYENVDVYTRSYERSDDTGAFGMGNNGAFGFTPCGQNWGEMEN